MARFVLAPASEQDIVSILAWTHEHFGEQGRLRYEALLIQVIEDIAENPERPDNGGVSFTLQPVDVNTSSKAHVFDTRVFSVLGRSSCIPNRSLCAYG